MWKLMLFMGKVRKREHSEGGKKKKHNCKGCPKGSRVAVKKTELFTKEKYQ